MSTTGSRGAMSLLGILVLAINLRPAITSVGPVINDLGLDLGLSAPQLGLLGAIPIVTFGVISPFVHVGISRFGLDRTLAAAMAVLTVSTVLRSWPGPNANVWVGTVLIGATIAVANVAVPIVVKKSFPQKTSTITALYLAVLGISAGLGAALAVPIADASVLGWRLALGGWAGVTVLALVYWTWRSLSPHEVASDEIVTHQEVPKSLWRSPLAWQLSIYMGAQSSVFYVSLTWLPTVEQSFGFSPVAAGWHMFVLQVAAVAGNFLAPFFMRVGNDERFAGILPGAVFLVSVAGLYYLPSLTVLWVSLIGFGTGAAFVVALSLMGTRAQSIRIAGKLSAMAQGVGYVLAALILFTAGAIAGISTSGVLVVLFGAGVLVCLAGLFTGRVRMV